MDYKPITDSCETTGEIKILDMPLSQENNKGTLLHVHDAEKMQDEETSLITKHCPIQCTALINMQEATVILDTGAGGSVVSAAYLEKIDKDWKQKN